jgi:hypothetical protein
VSFWPSAWLTAFVWTCALEQPFYIWALRERAARWWTPCLWTIAFNLMTHPALWLWASDNPHGPGELAAAEALVVVAEGAAAAYVLARAGEPTRRALARGFGASLAANLTSWLLGGRLLAGVI